MSLDRFDFSDPFKVVTSEPGEGGQGGGLNCEITTCEARYNSKGERTLLHGGTRASLKLPNDILDRNYNSALVLNKFYDKESDLEYSELEIRSPHIKTALKKVISDYPGVDLDGKKLVIRDYCKVLFHYRTELQDYAKALKDEVASEHLAFMLQHLYKILENEMRSYYNHVESPYLSPCLDFLNLWMAFRPGDFVYVNRKGKENVLRFRRMERCPCTLPGCRHSAWGIDLERLEYDGSEFGYSDYYECVHPYGGYKTFDELHLVPLRYHPKESVIREVMVARGKKFVALHGVHCREYEGTARVVSEVEDCFRLSSMKVKGRIMIDGKTFAAVRPSHQRYFHLRSRAFRTETGDQLTMSDDDYLICDDEIQGFSLADKEWCWFMVNSVKDVEYNSGAFENLLLPDKHKQMILSLVSIHQNQTIGFDDIIKGKGKGLVLLLHGAPGVGKTLTAESVADHAKRPLYTMSAGDLGITPFQVEKKLSDALQLALTWNAILLIDEADVYLERRSIHDIKRNSLVSVFLRVLEYYEGIMILTTNRVNTFDCAFQSRIHIAVKYHPLSVKSRRDLWRTFLAKAAPGIYPEWMNDDTLDELASHELNGREIKNIVRTAHALAVSQGACIRLEQVRLALTTLKKFEQDFTSGKHGVTSGETEEDTEETSESRPRKRRREE